MVLTAEGDVVAAADSRNSHLGRGGAPGKIRRLGEDQLLGVAGWSRLDSLWPTVRPSLPDAEEDVLAELRRQARAWLKAAAKWPAGGLVDSDDGGVGGSALVATPGRLWSVDGLGDVALLHRGYGAKGSGQEEARGALFALLHGRPAPARAEAEQVLRTAVLAAAEFDEYTDDRVQVTTLQRHG